MVVFRACMRAPSQDDGVLSVSMPGVNSECMCALLAYVYADRFDDASASVSLCTGVGTPLSMFAMHDGEAERA